MALKPLPWQGFVFNMGMFRVASAQMQYDSAMAQGSVGEREAEEPFGV